MVWKVAEAKQKFSEVLRRAAAAPQIVQNRDRVVGAILGAEDARAFLDFRGRKRAPLREVLREAAQICEEEGEDFTVPQRVDRSNPILERARAGRHQHRK
jgi:antitoxin (DNA-binding transcriptional repressor) of toxin-antitoxin stability system